MLVLVDFFKLKSSFRKRYSWLSWFGLVSRIDSTFSKENGQKKNGKVMHPGMVHSDLICNQNPTKSLHSHPNLCYLFQLQYNLKPIVPWGFFFRYFLKLHFNGRFPNSDEFSWVHLLGKLLLRQKGICINSPNKRQVRQQLQWMLLPFW